MHIVWAQGSVIVVKSIGEENNRYLKGHEGRITTITISLSGNLMATGEMARGVGQPAALIVWDFNRGQMQFRVKLHTQHVQSLSFNCEDTHLISVGGAEDRSRLVMWNLQEGKSEAAQPASEQLNAETTDIKFYNREANKFITGHNNGIKFQMVDRATGKFQSYDCQLGNLSKVFVTCVCIDKNDEFLYVGTRQGEVLEIML